SLTNHSRSTLVSRLSRGALRSRDEIVRVFVEQLGVVVDAGRNERNALGVRVWVFLEQLVGMIGPHERRADAAKPAEFAGALRDGEPRRLVDPPRDEFSNPRTRVRVARRADIGPDAASRAVAGEHVEELLGGKVRQLVETDQRDL